MATAHRARCLEALEQGEFALDVGEFRMAEELLGEVIRKTETMSTQEVGDLRAAALYHLSRVQQRQSLYEPALRTSEQALAHQAELRNPEHILGVQDQMADLLIQLGQYQRAIPFCEESIRLASEQKDAIPVADRLWRAGRCYVKSGLHDQAVVPLRQAIEIFKTRPEDPRTPVVLVDLGNALRRTQPADAETSYKEAAAIWEQKGRLESATTPWVNLGIICSQQNRHSEALAYYEKALRVRETSLGTPPARMGTLLNNISNCHRRMGQFSEAKRAIDRAIDLLQPSGDASLALAYGSRALIFRDEGSDAEAAEWFTRARREHEKQPSPNLADLVEVFENEAAALTRIGKTSDAKVAEERAAALRASISQTTAPQHDLSGLKIKPVRREQDQGAVLIQLDGSTLPDAVYRDYDLATLEDQLAEAIEPQGLGEFDGNEFGPENVTLFLYGADAEALFAAIEPVLKAYPLCQNARVIIRQGPPGSPEREVSLPSLPLF
jgi:tetratricopeptide (TPR) repeat protein